MLLELINRTVHAAALSALAETPKGYLRDIRSQTGMDHAGLPGRD
jgi:hypothetical protein